LVRLPLKHCSGPSRSSSLPWPNISSRGKWSVSSYKFGFGAECLRDGDPDTFWQCALCIFVRDAVLALLYNNAAQMVLNLISSLSNFLAKWQFRRVFVAFRCFASWHDSWGAQKLSILLSYPLDDSYTPATLAVRAGTGSSDLQDVRVISLEKPDGWITFDISGEPNDGLYIRILVVLSPQVLTLSQGSCVCICSSSDHFGQPHEWQRYSCPRFAYPGPY